MTRGKIRSGSSISSTMFTESSKPTIAKNAIAVATVTARNRPRSPPDSNTVIRPRSPSPLPTTQNPMAITITRAATSMRVSTTLNFTLSPTPRRLIRASSSMNASDTIVIAVLPWETPIPLMSRPARKLVASRLDDVEALVMPEQITANATRNVTKWMPNALCV